jgi:NDP-sugar pyrophosphorylase family protein
VVNYCDFNVYWNWTDFKRRMKETECAGAISAYKGFHPHSLGPNLYAYLKEKNNYLIEIQEKHCFTENRMNEYASAGTYYFRDGALLKHYFERAVNLNLSTNGEFYASTPYNLLVEDNLDVYIYELDQFLQWGTPEDLEEYQKWSDYFAKFASWYPQLTAMPGTNLIPMAGAGVRFSREGFSMPKPLVPVAGVSMIRRSLDSLPPAKQWVAACRSEHLQEIELANDLYASNRQVQILALDKLTEGQASTCLLAQDLLDPEEPLLIGPCDAQLVYDTQRYLQLITDPTIDCLVWTFRDHPHANRNPRQYGWVRTTSEGKVLGISCKMPISEDIKRDPGIIGTFWFRKAKFFIEAAQNLIKLNRRVNNEFYVDSAIDVLVEQGRPVRIFDVEHYICFGTPDDVLTYEYWHTYLRKVSHHPYSKEAR